MSDRSPTHFETVEPAGCVNSVPAWTCGAAVESLVPSQSFPEESVLVLVALLVGYAKSGSCGEAVFVDEAAERISTLDGRRRWMQDP